MPLFLGIDTGGTFTDAVLVEYGTDKVLASAKALTTKQNLTLGIRRAVERELEADPDIGKYALPDGLPTLRQAVAQTHLAARGLRRSPSGACSAWSRRRSQPRKCAIRIAPFPW